MVSLFAALSIVPSLIWCAPGVDYSVEGDNWDGVCMTSESQSPIALPRAVMELPRSCANMDLNLKDEPVDAALRYGSDGIMAAGPDLGVKLTRSTDDCKGKREETATWSLSGFHFHSPSEHVHLAADGSVERAAAELHLVFQDEDSNPRAVVGYLLDSSSDQESSFVTALMHSANETMTLDYLSLRWPDLDVFTQDNADFITYDGSLTTPPCTEGVEWFVSTIPISKEQEKYFQVLHHAPGVGNHRRHQELHGRPIEVIKSTTRIGEGDDGGQAGGARKVAATVLLAAALAGFFHRAPN